MSSPESSTSSLPATASPQASITALPSLDRLIDHFVAAKRSLSSTSQVWRANELVTRSRALVEEIAVLNARNTYARRGVDEQVDTLSAIRHAIADVGASAEHDLQTYLTNLDVAKRRLDETLERLRDTVIHPALQDLMTLQAAPYQDDASSAATLSPQGEKTLYDFVDESKHEGILSTLRSHVASFFQDARAALTEDLSTLDNSLANITNTLTASLQKKTSPQDSGPQRHHLIDIPSLFRGLEQNAAETANLLQSLIKHYDLCVSALKHTEGGGEAAKVAVRAQDLVKDTPENEESLYGRTDPEPISELERAEMLGILENDALEVEDVVAEIQGHTSDMETQFDQLETHAIRLRADNTGLQGAFTLLCLMRDALPEHLAACKTFRESWQAIQDGLQRETVALNEVTEFYAQFLVGYDSLLQEIRRREMHAERMKAVAAKANRELERLWEADQDARRQFFDDVGGHLPQDLYPALVEQGVKWEVRAVYSSHADHENS